MLTIEALVTAVFVMVLIGASIAGADTARSEERLRRLERGDPAAADAVRRAQAVADYARGGFLGLDAVALICTPSRRSLHVGGDLEEPEPEREARRRVGTAELEARAHGEARQAAAAAPVRSAGSRHAASARLSRRAARRARATRRRPAGIR